MRGRVLAVLNNPGSTFMEDDLKILRKHFTVDIIYRDDYPRIRYLILDIATRLLLHRPRLIYCWFVMPLDTYAIVLLARWMGVKSVLVTGGYDIANMPEIGYGKMRFPRHVPRTRFALNWANLVIPFSEFSRSEVLRVAHPRHMQVIYPGVDVDIFQPGNSEKQDLVITVGTVGRKDVKRKGWETFAECSKVMPHVRFVIIGGVVDNDVRERLESLGGKNLSFTSTRVMTEELVNWYQRAKVYVQASAHEGFGVAVAEAMACECVPVVTRAAALPEVVGDTGFYTTYGDVRAMVKAIEQALGSSKGPAACRRVLENFTLAQREERLLAELDNLLA